MTPFEAVAGVCLSYTPKAAANTPLQIIVMHGYLPINLLQSSDLQTCHLHRKGSWGHGETRKILLHQNTNHATSLSLSPHTLYIAPRHHFGIKVRSEMIINNSGQLGN